MPTTSPGFALTLRAEAPADATSPRRPATAVGDAGGVLTALDVVATGPDHIVVDLTCEVSPRVELRHRDDLSRACTPGVARVCRAIAADPDEARRLTVKRNTVAVVTDGSAVLGLGNPGPAAALPVMEGKAALFERFADVDAWPVCLDTQDTDEIVLAALTNALRVVGKKLADTTIVVSGVGAAGTAIIRLLTAEGAGDIVACDRVGVIHPDRDGLTASRRRLAEETNAETAPAANELHAGHIAPSVFDPDVAPAVAAARFAGEPRRGLPRPL
ncbi:malic enzyme-like NAD(P)-binding protein [Streptomyces sp. NPDC021212]|uniref:malic enzyme-like NAD(P)-binding protein n=1 Tax=Streptomyces sp. NPDC021212 TaxID=3365118 RepID=UPI00378B7ECD